MIDENRVVFYPKENMACGWMLSKAEGILDNFDENRVYTNINDIIELYQIKQYLDAGLFLQRWDESKINLYKSHVSKIWSIINCFLNDINDSNVEKCYHDIEDWRLKDAFWQLVDKCKIYRRVAKNALQTLINSQNIGVILKHENLVECYDLAIKVFLESYEKSAEIILSKYELTSNHNKENNYLPKSLTKDDKVEILSRYIDWADSKLCYLNLIVIAKNHNDFNVPDKIRLKANKAINFKTKEITLTNSSVIYHKINFIEDQLKPVILSRENENLIISYGGAFIKDNSDHFSLFQNFGILFRILDNQSRITLISKESEFSFIDMFVLKSSNSYHNGIEFESKNDIALLQVKGYSRFLEQNDIFIEDVIKNTFNDYCQANDIDNLGVSFPSKDLTKLEKIRYLLPEMESLIKKYKLYVEDGVIDMELLSISSNPHRIHEIPSINKNKYIYGIDSKIGKVLHCFFSDQSMLFYVEPHKNKYHSLFDLLVKEDVKLSDLKDYMLTQYQQLIDEQYLKIEDDYIRINKCYELLILRELYNNEFISYHHLPPEFKTAVDDLYSIGHVEFGDTLMSKPEISYYNYFLDKSEYINGPDLRNKYEHGTHNNNQKSIEDDYYRILILVTILVWKIINDIHLLKIKKVDVMSDKI